MDKICEQIGWEECTVEMDEAKIRKRKYNKQRLTTDIWWFRKDYKKIVLFVKFTVV